MLGYIACVTRLSLQRMLTHLCLTERRAKGQEPGDDALSRLRLETFQAVPLRWLKVTISKLAVVFVLAGLAAGLFTGGLAVMRATGLGP